MIYTPGFINIGSVIQKLIWVDAQTARSSHKPTFIFQNKESGLKHFFVYMGAVTCFFLPLAPHFGVCSHFWSLGLISQFLDHFTDGRTPWTGDQLVTRPLHIHRTTQTQKNVHTHTSNLHALSGIRTQDPGF
jgi:hypothetical protein